MTSAEKEAKDTLQKLGEQYPKFMAAFNRFMQESSKEGAIDEKTKELIAIAVSVSKQCKWCIHLHVKKAMELGATKDEIMESSFVSTLMGGGPALMYIQEVMKALEE